MDKKNLTIGVLLIGAAIGWLVYSQRFAPPAPVPAPAVATAAAPAGQPAAGPAGYSAAAPIATPTGAFAALAPAVAPGALVSLENEYIVAHFTPAGGAVQDVALKKYSKELGHPEPYVFNALHADPLLAFTDFAGLDQHTAYTLVSHSATEVVYRTTLFEGRVEVTRRYSIVATPDGLHDPYQIRHETTFRNLRGDTVPLPRFALSLGTAEPLNDSVYGQAVTVGYATGQDTNFFQRNKLESSSGFLGFGAHDSTPFVANSGPIVWASVSNQFFATILTPAQPGAGLLTRRVKLFPARPDDDHQAFGLASSAQFEVAPLAPHGESKLVSDLYVGPKEYKRLSNSDVFKADQDAIMQWGKYIGFFSKILVRTMAGVHSWFPGAAWAWGWAIVLTTLILKIVFVPFTIAASRSARRMQKIQPELQAVREKFKDNPQKVQAATLELFKKHKVNPVGGCIPILITLPFFFGFFQMLRGVAELRFQPFLWATDLAQADTVGHVFGLPINILPVLMGATMVIQMHLTPTPSVDNAQVKMMKFMPYVFALFCYNFSCALALYSTVNGIFTIGQQLVINRMRDDGDPATAAPATKGPAGKGPGGRPLKNVTPKK